ncbi:carboxylate-amine ligase [Glutamicibacter endophyticus]|uniref:carboxylate-amine ligase n=1 Tax=Glutamicibacter endophyticus TaxID=1522174 RepID=UPI003AEF2EB4
MSSFGIEEEFFMLDAETGLPAEPDPNPFKELLDAQRDGQVQHELLACQLEYASAICEDRNQAIEELSSFRRALAQHAEGSSMIVAGLGAAPMIAQKSSAVTNNQRYREIDASMPGITNEHYMCGLHIHVSIPDRTAGVTALNFLRPWLPLFCALGANSPLWRGTDSGFSSWRNIHYRKWSVQGIPPVFADAADYERRLQTLIQTEAVTDQGHIGWSVRLSENHPTIELRVADSQLRAHDSVLLAVLARALVDTALQSGSDLPEFLPEVLDIAFWQAAKHGLTGNHVNPWDGCTVTPRDLMSKLLRTCETALRASGDYDFAVHSLRNVLEVGNGAVRQREAFARGSISQVLANAHSEMRM